MNPDFKGLTYTRESLRYFSDSLDFMLKILTGQTQNQWFPNLIDGALRAVGECEREEKG